MQMKTQTKQSLKDVSKHYSAHIEFNIRLLQSALVFHSDFCSEFYEALVNLIFCGNSKFILKLISFN